MYVLNFRLSPWFEYPIFSSGYFPPRQIVVGRRFGTVYQFNLQRLGVQCTVYSVHPAFEDGTDTGFRNVGLIQFDAGEIPRRKYTICVLHYDPQHVSSRTLLIFRRTNYITTASGIVTLQKQPYSMQVESGLQSALHLHTVLYGCLWRVTIPEAVVIQFVLLRMSSVLLETCWGS